MFGRDFFSARHLVTLHRGERERRARNEGTKPPPRFLSAQKMGNAQTNLPSNERERDFAFVHRTTTTTPVLGVQFFSSSLSLVAEKFEILVIGVVNFLFVN